MQKRMLPFIAAILILVPAFASADDWLDSVLEEARERFGSRHGLYIFVEEDSHPYFPFLVSFVPYLSFPMGNIDTSFSFAAIGATAHDVYGFMNAGVFNISHDVAGSQVAGVFNISHDVAGLQCAGVFNIAENVAVSQVAGVFDIAKSVRGVQVAGVFNAAQDVKGAQIAGVVNTADELQGVQISGVFNGAKQAKGLQLGLVNVAEEIDGVQLGLVSIARDGARGLGVVSEPSNGYVMSYWQNGTRALYTVVSAEIPGSQLFSSVDRLVVSGGLGTRIGGRHGTSSYLDIEALAAQEIGSRLGSFASFFASGDSSCLDLPYPELRLRLGLPLSRQVHLVGGMSVDLDLAALPMVPAGLKSNASFSTTQTWFGGTFTAYGRWFFGVKI